jgi:hypothetical protein
MARNANEVEGAIAQLKAGIDAAAVALIEARGDSPDTPPNALHSALHGLPCLTVDWAAWFKQLFEAEQLTTTCECQERHQLHGLVIERRWALVALAPNLLLSDDSFQPAKALAYAEWVFAIRFFLTEAGTSSRRSGSSGRGGGAIPAELGIPLSWHRKVQG